MMNADRTIFLFYFRILRKRTSCLQWSLWAISATCPAIPVHQAHCHFPHTATHSLTKLPHPPPPMCLFSEKHSVISRRRIENTVKVDIYKSVYRNGAEGWGIIYLVWKFLCREVSGPTHRGCLLCHGNTRKWLAGVMIEQVSNSSSPLAGPRIFFFDFLKSHRLYMSNEFRALQVTKRQIWHFYSKFRLKAIQVKSKMKQLVILCWQNCKRLRLAK